MLTFKCCTLTQVKVQMKNGMQLAWNLQVITSGIKESNLSGAVHFYTVYIILKKFNTIPTCVYASPWRLHLIIAFSGGEYDVFLYFMFSVFLCSQESPLVRSLQELQEELPINLIHFQEAIKPRREVISQYVLFFLGLKMCDTTLISLGWWCPWLL